MEKIQQKRIAMLYPHYKCYLNQTNYNRKYTNI